MLGCLDPLLQFHETGVNRVRQDVVTDEAGEGQSGQLQMALNATLSSIF